MENSNAQVEVTYSDPKVVELIKSRYIPVRVDQDSRPDISRRYENYGWPATVVFNAEGGEIVKRRGYLQPEVMISMLEEIIIDASPVNYGDNEPIARFADSPHRVVGPSRRQHAESRRSLSATAPRSRLHLHGQHVLVADLRRIEADRRG